MGLFQSPAQWTAIGNSLGLTAYEPTAAYAPGVGFRAIKRALGYPAGQLPPSFSHWFYGRVQDVEVMLVAYTEGSGSSTTEMNALIARIDPPLFLGLSMTEKPFLELFANRNRRFTGDKLIDDHICIDAFDHQRAFDCLALNTLEGRELISRVLQHQNNIHVGDSVVAFAKTGYEPDLADARYRLDMVVFMAKRLAWLKSKLPPTEAELAQRANWQAFAKEVGFQFDPLRMTVFGQRNGAHLKIALETDGQQVRTAVNVRFPRAVHVAFTARKTKSGIHTFLAGLFGQDIVVGNAVFDDLYIVTGHPEHLVRQTLGHPDLITVMNLLAASATEVQLNHQQLLFRVVGFIDSAQLHQVCETARITCEALFGRLSSSP